MATASEEFIVVGRGIEPRDTIIMRLILTYALDSFQITVKYRDWTQWEA
jgi:hypothetical protein